MKVAALDDIPALLPFASQYWEAFIGLSDCREWTENGYPKPIMVSEILAITQILGLDDHWERSQYYQHIRMMDRAYVGYKSEIAKKNNDKAQQRRRQP